MKNFKHNSLPLPLLHPMEERAGERWFPKIRIQNSEFRILKFLFLFLFLTPYFCPLAHAQPHCIPSSAWCPILQNPNPTNAIQAIAGGIPTAYGKGTNTTLFTSDYKITFGQNFRKVHDTISSMDFAENNCIAFQPLTLNAGTNVIFFGTNKDGIFGLGFIDIVNGTNLDMFIPGSGGDIISSGSLNFENGYNSTTGGATLGGGISAGSLNISGAGGPSSLANTVSFANAISGANGFFDTFYSTNGFFVGADFQNGINTDTSLDGLLIFTTQQSIPTSSPAWKFYSDGDLLREILLPYRGGNLSGASYSWKIGESTNALDEIYTTNLFVSGNISGAMATNTAAFSFDTTTVTTLGTQYTSPAQRSTLELTISATDAIGGSPAFKIERAQPGGTNRIQPLILGVTGTTTNFYSFRLNPGINFKISNVSGTGASVAIVSAVLVLE